MLSIIMPSAIILRVIKPSVIMLSVIMLSVIILNVRSPPSRFVCLIDSRRFFSFLDGNLYKTPVEKMFLSRRKKVTTTKTKNVSSKSKKKTNSFSSFQRIIGYEVIQSGWFFESKSVGADSNPCSSGSKSRVLPLDQAMCLKPI